MKSSLLPIVCMISAAIVGGAISAPLKIELPAETATLKKAPGAELVTAHCLICHSAEYMATQPPLPRIFWQGSVKKMQEKFGAPITAADVDAVVDYLTKNYGTDAAPAAK